MPNRLPFETFITAWPRGIAARAMQMIVTMVLTAGLLSGCGSAGEKYPSLAVRDVERAPANLNSPANAPGDKSESEGTQETAQETAQKMAQAGAQAAIEELQAAQQANDLVKSAKDSHSAFVEAAGKLRTTASGGAGGSNKSPQRLMALARLDVMRIQTALILADLDRLYIGQSIALSDRALLRAARNTVQDWVREEDLIMVTLNQ